ncbi:hypothetical protein [Kitasatospora sp. SUK 42]|uniref:hypothetical protein n=1 Tax=Kitasatospora sp. SUK 42 TaxID=1588882 RepID=UPI0018CA3FEF|nr:hypothetical protein [Kitasatospora sp. SUK 42]MBV2155342.1 hypothetical protein [Kitasatospora sp. SUK 42]
MSDDRTTAQGPYGPRRESGDQGEGGEHAESWEYAESEEFVEADELAELDEFLRVCAELTGFDVAELRATGMAQEHHRTALAHPARDEHALVHLWYVGAWPGEAPTSARAHDQGLVWRTFHGSPPGTASPGHGSWALAPRGGEER